MRKSKSYIGANLTHDASICQVTDGHIDWFIEEERFSKVKHDKFPFTSIMESDLAKDLHNMIQISGLYEPHKKDELTEYSKLFTSLCQKKYSSTIAVGPHEDIEYEYYLQHHDFHAACGFYNSGFPRAAVLVVDGMGNPLDDSPTMHEVETIYTLSYPQQFKKHSVNVTPTYLDVHTVPHLCFGIGMIYQSLANYFGFGDFGSGKLMGLSAYGEEDSSIESFFDGTLNTDIFFRSRFGLTFIPYDYVRYPNGVTRFSDIDSKDIKQRFANLAYRVQKDFENYMITLILKTLEITGEKNLVLTGGCALNCVANYEYLKHLPEDVKLYVEPISTDAGVSVGLAKINYYSATKSTSRHPLKTLYLGRS